ncbi:MAG TPA: DUF523 domain-containing protein [Campylobacterales bacterium]|nr:DUF523 domain-containing protein [Campylobacterales bacterium]
MKKVALSACLMGHSCRYDASDNLNETLLKKLSLYKIIPFCPEDDAFGSPRPTMDLIENGQTIEAISNKTNENLSLPITLYAQNFFNQHPDIKLFIGKDRSPSCGVCSAKIYNQNRDLIATNGTGLMAQEALKRGITSWDSELY